MRSQYTCGGVRWVGKKRVRLSKFWVSKKYWKYAYFVNLRTLWSKCFVGSCWSTYFQVLAYSFPRLSSVIKRSKASGENRLSFLNSLQYYIFTEPHFWNMYLDREFARAEMHWVHTTRTLEGAEQRVAISALGCCKYVSYLQMYSAIDRILCKK